MLPRELQIARLKAQLEWYKGEVYAAKTIQMILERIKKRTGNISVGGK